MAERSSLHLTQEQLDELKDTFDTIDPTGESGHINVSQLGEALEVLGYKIPGYQVRNYIRDYETYINGDQMEFEGFKQLCARVKADKDLGHAFKKVVTKRANIETHGGMTTASSEGTTHTVRREEQVAFSNWINRNLADDPDCGSYLMLDAAAPGDLYAKCADGILFCKMINKSQPGTIDERTINKTNLTIYRKHENLTLALNSAQSIGCNIVNIGAEDIEAGKPHLVLGLLWQIIRIGLLADINLHEHPGLAALLEDGESLEEFMKLSPEQILIRWVNYHLQRSGCGRQVTNFSADIKDSIAYINLLQQIAPRDKGVTTGPTERELDLLKRAELMLREADKIGCRQFVTPGDVVDGNPKLNLAFVANLFNSFPALDTPVDLDLEDVVEETREEKTYRNWMNSMGVSPYVNRIYADLTDGLIIFQLYDIIKPGIVDWNRVITKFSKMSLMMQKLENCNYAVELGKKCKFSLVGIDGKNLYDGNETLTLALVWQLMKAYTLSILARLAESETGHPIVDKEIITWVNTKLKENGKKTSITGFNDHMIADGRVVIDLVDAIKPGSVDYKLVGMTNTQEDCENNAKLAISLARKIGARVYALPEDIVEVKPKMVMTVFACLMIRDYQSAEKPLTS